MDKNQVAHSDPEGYSSKRAKNEEERARMEGAAKDGLIQRLRRPWSRPPTGENVPEEIRADEQFMETYRNELTQAWAQWVNKNPSEIDKAPPDIREDPRLSEAEETGWGLHYERKILSDPVGTQEQLPERLREHPEFSAKRRELWRGLVEQHPSYKHITPKDLM